MHIHHHSQTHQKSFHTNIDHIPPNTTHCWCQCYVVCLWGHWGSNQNDYLWSKSQEWGMFHGPTALLWVWLSGRIILNPQIQIRYTDSKHQLEDTLTKGNFTRDEWNKLFHLFNISNFSSLRCIKKISLIICTTMAKKNSGTKRRRKGCVQVATSSDFLSSYFMSSSSSAASSPITSKSPVTSGASGKSGSRMNLQASSFDAASASHVRLKDAYLGWLKEE